MDTQLLDAIRIIMREELKRIDTRLRSMDYKLVEQDNKLDTMLEAWQIQKIHRQELNDHEVRIQKIENHIPVIS